MIKTLLFGSNGFLGSHLQSKLDGEVIGVNIRQQNWQENIPDDAHVFINCIGKAHDHKVQLQNMIIILPTMKW